MRIIIITILFSFLQIKLSGFYAQGNLQFNQVLRVGNTAQTVPVGKVWKVETYMQSNTSISEFTEYPNCNFPDRQHPFLINSVPYYQINGSPGHGSSGIMMAVGNLFPLWLKSGEILQTTCPNNFLSVIEYNVVP
ncbi:MAG: hypothetical protein FJX99_02135 [Bacteroidetes bacterium]|nr:hypothetical protein [Bacteroidota bacterium]